MAEDRITEVRRLDQFVASARSLADQAESDAMRQWVPLLVDEMQSTAELRGQSLEAVLTEYYFSGHRVKLMWEEGTLFGELRHRAPGGGLLMFFVRLFNEELEARNVSVRLRMYDESWYSPTLYRV